MQATARRLSVVSATSCARRRLIRVVRPTPKRHMKLEQGDAFELLNAAWIRERIPCYEQIWSAFIGHNGLGWPLLMQGISPEQEVHRKRFYQAHYTFALQALEVDQLVSGIDERIGEVRDYPAFVSALRELSYLMSSIGQIRDMFKIMDEALRMGGHLYCHFQDFYCLRSHILHGPRIPARLRDGLFMIPKIATQNAAFGEWDDKASWDSVPDQSFVYFADFCRITRDDLFALITQQHPSIFPAADSYFGGRRVAATGDPSALISLPSLSGVSVFPAISAFTRPSGVYAS